MIISLPHAFDSLSGLSHLAPDPLSSFYWWRFCQTQFRIQQKCWALLKRSGLDFFYAQKILLLFRQPARKTVTKLDLSTARPERGQKVLAVSSHLHFTGPDHKEGCEIADARRNKPLISLLHSFSPRFSLYSWSKVALLLRECRRPLLSIMHAYFAWDLFYLPFSPALRSIFSSPMQARDFRLSERALHSRPKNLLSLHIWHAIVCQRKEEEKYLVCFNSLMSLFGYV